MSLDNRHQESNAKRKDVDQKFPSFSHRSLVQPDALRKSYSMAEHVSAVLHMLSSLKGCTRLIKIVKTPKS